MKTWSKGTGKKYAQAMAAMQKPPLPSTPSRRGTMSGGGSKKLQVRALSILLSLEEIVLFFQKALMLSKQERRVYRYLYFLSFFVTGFIGRTRKRY